MILNVVCGLGVFLEDLSFYNGYNRIGFLIDDEERRNDVWMYALL